MTSLCPLCGKNKSDDALFCEQCSKKIQTDYEVNMPETAQQNRVCENTEKAKIAKIIEVAEKIEEPPPTSTPISEKPPQKKRNMLLVGICLAALLLIGGFFFFNNSNTPQSSRSEQTDWQIATQTNTVAAFETFIEMHPRGQHFAQAVENIRILRQQETEAWEAVRESNNIAVLQEFVNQFPENPHVVQAKAQIDLLTWERDNPPPPIDFQDADDTDSTDFR